MALCESGNMFKIITEDLQKTLKSNLPQIRFLLKKNPAIAYKEIGEIGKKVGEKYNVELLVNLVKSDGAQVKLHDPFVSYWQELSCEVESDINKVLVSEPDLVIISTAHSVYKKEAFIDKISSVPASKIYDAVGLLSNEQIQKLKSKHRVSVLGRGDIS